MRIPKEVRQSNLSCPLASLPKIPEYPVPNDEVRFNVVPLRCVTLY